MIHSVDISDQTFNCVKCGNCCYNVLREHNTGEYGYNFRGELVLNPKTSLTILYNEKYELKQNLLKFDLQARFYPEMVFFMKDYPYGFEYSYQLGVKKKKYCLFYDLSKRECKVYPVRPIICRTYPLGCNAFEGSNLLPEATCTGVKEMINQVDPYIKEGELVYYPFSQNQMASVFRSEFFLGANIIGFTRWELKIILDNLGSMFLDDKSVTPSRVSDYTLLNFQEFLGWAKVKITDKHQKLTIQLFSQNLELGKQHFAEQLVNLVSKKK